MKCANCPYTWNGDHEEMSCNCSEGGCTQNTKDTTEYIAWEDYTMQSFSFVKSYLICYNKKFMNL